MISSTGKAPYWSVMITTFNRSYIRQSLASVLAQDRGPDQMQIQVVDDCSTKLDIQAIVKEIGGQRVEFHRNPTTQGFCGNWNVCIERARGEWIHILHDDDVVYPGFYEAMEAAGDAPQGQREIGAAFCRVDNIDAAGKSLGPFREERPVAGIYEGFDRRCFMGNAILFPGMVVKKKAYQEMGPFDVTLDYSPDWVMWVKIAQKYAVWYEPRILAGYRRHSDAATMRMIRKGGDYAGIGQALDKIATILPPTLENRQQLVTVREDAAKAALAQARNILRTGDLTAGLNMVYAGLRCSCGLAVLRDMEQGLLRHWDEFVREAWEAIQNYTQHPDDAEKEKVARRLRQRLAVQLLEFEPRWMPVILSGASQINALCLSIVQSELPDASVLEDEQPLVVMLKTRLRQMNLADEAWGQVLAAAMFYCRPKELVVPLSRVPDWLMGDYLRAVLRVSKQDLESAGEDNVSILDKLESEAKVLAAGSDPKWKQVHQFLGDHRNAACRK